jgi:hypothetical protein
MSDFMKESMQLIKIRDILTQPESNPDTWLYLPPNPKQWDLDTEGVFSLDSFEFPPDSDEFLPEQVKKNGWVEVLDGASIEDIVINANSQLENPSLDKLFQAFTFYYENDAFLEF